MVALLSGAASAVTYSGSLASSDGGLFVSPGGAWSRETMSVAWIISSETPPPAIPEAFRWRYEYTLTVGEPKQGAFSHELLEVSGGFVISRDMAGLNGATVTDGIGGGSANLGLPQTSDTWIKFSPTSSNATTWTFSFFSPLAPVWGDFYMKDGKAGGADNYAYNADFTSADPEIVAGSGTVGRNILRPGPREAEAKMVTPVPEPMTMASGFLAAGCVGVYIRRRIVS